MAEEGGIWGGTGGVEAVELGHALFEAEEDGGAGGGGGGDVVEGGGEEGVPGRVGGAGFDRAEEETRHIPGQAETLQVAAQGESGTDQGDAVEGTQTLLRGGGFEHKLTLMEQVHTPAPAAAGLTGTAGSGMQQAMLLRAPNNDEPVLPQRIVLQHRAHVLLHTNA